ncbi:MAG TPA: DUF4118 domain-containing protein [Ideonella sp.]|nr:DUF4118 domain-containing protein [Ideonella sp.]
MEGRGTPDRSADWRRLAALAVALAAATAVDATLDPWVSHASQAMVYLLAVTLVAYRLPWNWSAGFAIAAVTAFNFFFVPPRYTLEVENHEYMIALATMLAVALVVSRLAASSRRDAERSRRDALRARQVQALAVELADAGAGDLLALGEAALRESFESVTVVAVEPAAPGASPSSGELIDALRCCTREAAVLGPGTPRWPGLDAWYVPLLAGGRALGAACLQPAHGPDVELREHAQALCALIGQALARSQLAAAVRQAQAQSERERWRNLLLAGVSHDLRTPLAVIVGAASALQAQCERLPETERQRLLASILAEANHLARIADNTLQLVRLADRGTPLQRGWESIEEVVGAVLARVRDRDPARRIRSHIPSGLPLVRADAVLLAQALGNLLDNALEYSDGPIELAAEAAAGGETLRVEVKDRGPGVDPGQLDALCEPFVRGDAVSGRGLGLGLAVCRAIADAHGGALSVRRRPGGGSAWRLSLPLEPAPSLGGAT